jgi:hypothetical protein
MNKRGQALVESIPILMVMAGILGALVMLTQWFLIRQKLLIAVREGAMLYSSGRHTASEVDFRMRRYLESGSLPLNPKRLQLRIGRSSVRGSTMAHLDEVRASYRPGNWLQRRFQQIMEEKCVIKHAPHYGLPWQTLHGPAVPW